MLSFRFAVPILYITLLFITNNLQAQSTDKASLPALITSFKTDIRGPYQAIRWFCPDGRVLPPQQPCGQPGAIQHALHKDIVQRIAREQHIFLGQILAGTALNDFFDAANHNSRMKQYMLEQFLQRADNGWIMRRARFYRGAIQAEDEEEWGRRFLSWLTASNQVLVTQFSLARSAAHIIPHSAPSDETSRWERIRAVSKTIADSLTDFMDLRVKLHGQPDRGDIQRVQDFQQKNAAKIKPSIKTQLTQLLTDLEMAYRPFNVASLKDEAALLPEELPLRKQLQRFISQYPTMSSPAVKAEQIANLLYNARREIIDLPAPAGRIAVLDVSNELESMLFLTCAEWHPETIGGLLQKTYLLAKGATGTGYLEQWEWQQIEPVLKPVENGAMSLEKFIEVADYTRRAVEWGTGTIRANFEPVTSLFATFEPLANGFIDDQVRVSILLPFGEVGSTLREIAARESGLRNRVMNLSNVGSFQGLNPGYAMGELVTIIGSPDDIEFSPNKIYAIQRPPADLKPVAGIATVAEGNLVSHVQLLARNLGIPNAALTMQNLNDLKRFDRQKVFYAVSPRGAVLMKAAGEMSRDEKALFDTRRHPEERIAVPIEKINFKQVQPVNLRKLRATDSGQLCGPKAANLGELKWLFPEHVVEGIAIPFGIFRLHMAQAMPGTGSSYWQFLQSIFRQAEADKKEGVSEAEIEVQILGKLATLRAAIRDIPLMPEFVQELGYQYEENFKAGFDKVPVFIRSDTNMEDLKDFTGAGLNLTVFNVVGEAKVLQGIRDVWASPYTERSYQWRQKYLLNPENVFPSILIIPSVDVDKSGVMITTGITSGDRRDITVAFSRGAGGAVEGQAAETYLLRSDGGYQLLSPAREESYTALPATGGTIKLTTHFNQPLLSSADLQKLRSMAANIIEKLAKTTGVSSNVPWDVELGFKDGKIWLFQVRPYVENKRARSSQYLQGLDPEMPKNRKIQLDSRHMSQGR